MIPPNVQTNESREMVELESISVQGNENNADYFWVKKDTVKLRKKRKSKQSESPRIHEVEVTN